MNDQTNNSSNSNSVDSTKSAFVALLGAPNAGKSTLVNYLVGSKVSIVTHKVQTTRSLIRGVVNYEEVQLVLIDSPGVFKGKKRLEKAMIGAAWDGARDGDFVLLIVDAAAGLTEAVEEIMAGLPKIKVPVILVLNKIDKIPVDSLLALTDTFNKQFKFIATFMISAMTGAGCSDLLAYLASISPAGPHYYPDDQLSDMPLRQLASEITREKLFLRLHKEIPYASTVETEKWEEKPDGSIKISQVIYVQRANQKRILLGHNGQTIKAVGQAARKELEVITGQKVHLFLFVKVRGNWLDDPERYREMGLDFRS